MDKILLGKRIKEARIERHFTLDNLSDAIGLNKSTVSRYERGEIDNPKLPVIQAIASALHTNPSWLIGKSEEKSYTPPNSDFTLLEPCNLFKPLRVLREARELSLDQVAYCIGISKDDYEAIENGHNTDCITLARIANFFCCGTDFALSFDGVFDEDSHLEFTRTTLFRLDRAFMNLPSHDQERVVSYAQDLANNNIVTLKIAGRDGSYKEIRVTQTEYEIITHALDALPNASEDL